MYIYDRYFLIGPGMKPKVAVNSFIEDMQFDKHHYEKITAFDRNVIAKNQGRVLRYAYTGYAYLL